MGIVDFNEQIPGKWSLYNKMLLGEFIYLIKSRHNLRGGRWVGGWLSIEHNLVNWTAASWQLLWKGVVIETPSSTPPRLLIICEMKVQSMSLKNKEILFLPYFF